VGDGVTGADPKTGRVDPKDHIPLPVFKPQVGFTMPGAFSSVAVVVFDLDERGQAIRTWETFPDGDECDAIAEAKRALPGHAGVLVWKRENNPAVGEEGDRSWYSGPVRSATSTDVRHQSQCLLFSSSRSLFWSVTPIWNQPSNSHKAPARGGC
jgi:hypothetical protein